ncbi:MAG TPA: acetyl-coenzyme A synthetase, partial [Candidatus Pseudomonas excrementavium]|nr:acetyl-coenzyme A synthetase [Candidatus Pseudomonas excrementavium]
MYKIEQHQVSEAARRNTHLDADGYERLYRQSIEQPDTFWAEQANRFVEWMQPWSKVQESNMVRGEAAWFIDGKLNVSANCIDRHLATRGDQTAIIWEGDDPGQDRRISYRELHEQ